MVLVVGLLVINENREVIRVRTPKDRLVSLSGADASETIAAGEIPLAWNLFGTLYHSLVTDSFMGWCTMEAITLDQGSRKWLPGQSPGIVTNLTDRPVICRLAENP